MRPKQSATTNPSFTRCGSNIPRWRWRPWIPEPPAAPPPPPPPPPEVATMRTAMTARQRPCQRESSTTGVRVFSVSRGEAYPSDFLGGCRRRRSRRQFLHARHLCRVDQVTRGFVLRQGSEVTRIYNDDFTKPAVRKSQAARQTIWMFADGPPVFLRRSLKARCSNAPGSFNSGVIQPASAWTLLLQ